MTYVFLIYSTENKGSRLSSHQMNSGSSGREALMEGGRSQSITMPPSSMKMKPQPTSTPAVFTGSSSSFSSNTSNKPKKTEAELINITDSIMKVAACESKTELFIEVSLHFLLLTVAMSSCKARSLDPSLPTNERCLSHWCAKLRNTFFLILICPLYRGFFRDSNVLKYPIADTASRLKSGHT